MKKILALVLASIFLTALPAGCSAATSGAAKTVKTGMAFVTALDKSTGAGTGDGSARADACIAAVTVDGAGKIVRCALDLMEMTAAFDSAGQLKTAPDAKFQTKNEQGADAGLKALTDYFAGKTAEQVKATAVDSAGNATDGKLKEKVTFPVTGIIAAVAKALDGAQDLGAAAGDRIGTGISANIAYSNNAGTANPAVPDGGKNYGNALFYTTIAAATTDKNGKITSCLTDGLQCAVSFDATGKIVSDLTKVPPTKNERGSDFGMKAFSSISREWFEQTAAIGKYVKGKTVKEIDGIALKDDTTPASEDMRATVTVKFAEFKKVLVKAATQ
jgi:hypothetical protein